MGQITSVNIFRTNVLGACCTFIFWLFLLKVSLYSLRIFEDTFLVLITYYITRIIDRGTNWNFSSFPFQSELMETKDHDTDYDEVRWILHVRFHFNRFYAFSMSSISLMKSQWKIHRQMLSIRLSTKMVCCAPTGIGVCIWQGLWASLTWCRSLHFRSGRCGNWDCIAWERIRNLSPGISAEKFGMDQRGERMGE